MEKGNINENPDQNSLPEGSSALSVIRDQYETLVAFKKVLVDQGFLVYDIQEIVDERIQKAEIILNKSKEECFGDSKVEYEAFIGKFFNLSNIFLDKAICALSKAVKLDPQKYVLWNMLGECYWHKKDQELAEKCFQNSLEQQRNPVALRNLSIIARKIESTDLTVIRECTERGIALAKEAVSLDVQDGISWSILGNAYISAFFGVGPDPSFAYKAISAYKQAEKTYGKDNCDLYHNKYVALKFVEEYQEAFVSLDKALSLSPNWALASAAKISLVKYLNNVHLFNSTNGKLKPKRLSLLKKSLTTADLGLLADKFKWISFAELKEGVNLKTIICGKVTWNLQMDDTFPFTFGCIDTEGTAVVITVYNLAQKKGFIIGDSIAIPEPFVSMINFSYENNECHFTKIRVNSPNSLIYNGRPTPSNFRGSISFVSRDP